MKKKPSARTPGCECSQNRKDYSIDFCPLHAAAPELLQALKLACEVLRSKSQINIALELEKAIAKAEGR